MKCFSSCYECDALKMPFSAAFTQRAVHYTSTHACTHLRVCFPLFLIFTCTCIVGAVFVLAVICKRCARKMRYFFGWTVKRYVVSVFVRRRSYPHTISKLLTQNCVYFVFSLISYVYGSFAPCFFCVFLSFACVYGAWHFLSLSISWDSDTNRLTCSQRLSVRVLCCFSLYWISLNSRHWERRNSYFLIWTRKVYSWLWCCCLLF